MFEIIILIVVVYALVQSRKNVTPNAKRENRGARYRNNFYSDTPHNDSHNYYNHHHDSHSECDSSCDFDFDGGCDCGCNND